MLKYYQELQPASRAYIDLSGGSPVYARNEKIAGTAPGSYVNDRNT